MSFLRLKTARARRIARISGIATGCAVVLWLGVSFFVNRYYEGYIRGRLETWVNAGTDSLYQIRSGDVEINLFTRELTITDIRLWPDSIRLKALRSQGRAPLNTLNVRIPAISLRGLTWRKLRKGGTVRIRSVVISSPQITWQQQPRSTVDEAYFANPRPKGDESTVPEKITINRFQIENPALTYAAHHQQEPWAFSARGGAIDITDWEYLRDAPRDTGRLLGASAIAATLRNIRWEQHANPYVLRAGSVHINSGKGIGAATDFLLERGRSAGLVREAYRLSVAHAMFTGLDLHRALHYREVVAGELSLYKPDITVSHTRGLARPDSTVRRSGHFPQQLLLALPVPIAVPQVTLTDGHVAYVEHNPKTAMTANLLFGSIEGLVTGLSNMADRPTVCAAAFGGTFMERSPMYARFVFNLRDSLASFGIKARLLELNGAQVSDAAQALALARIQKLHISEMNMDLTGSDSGTKATISLAYDKLKVHLQQIDEETGSLYIRPVLSLLANKLMLYPSNPLPGAPLRIAHTNIVRSPTESFFHLIWRNLFDATLQTALRDEGMRAVMEHRKARKAEREENGKRRFFKSLGKKR